MSPKLRLRKTQTGGDGMTLEEIGEATMAQRDNTAVSLILKSLSDPEGPLACAQTYGDTHPAPLVGDRFQRAHAGRPPRCNGSGHHGSQSKYTRLWGSSVTRIPRPASQVADCQRDAFFGMGAFILQDETVGNVLLLAPGQLSSATYLMRLRSLEIPSDH
jgi:hypothetical protein